MFSYKFYIDNKRGEALMLRITNNRRKAEMGMGLAMAQKDLDKVLSWRTTSYHLSAVVADWDKEIKELMVELAGARQGDMEPKEIVKILRKRLLGKSGNNEEDAETMGKGGAVKESAFKLFFIQHKDAYERRSTRESNAYTLSVMEKFCKEKGVILDSVDFEDINYAWLSDFELWMKKAGMSQNTRKIHFGNIRTAIRDAYKREITNADPFRRFTFRPGKTRKRSLSIKELRELFTCPVASHTVFYRDMMKLSFMFLGINTVDLYNLKEIRDGRIEYTRSKTGGLFSIKIEPEAMEIIEKYRGEKNLLIPADRWSDHRNFRHQLNAAIKRIGKAQGKGIKDLEGEGPFAEVTSYWMRHTWSTIAADLDISDATISLALGHEGGENRTTNIYIRRNQKKVDEANRRVLDWVLYGKR